MILAAIVAHDPNLLIGKDGDLPWRSPEDLQYFKRMTMGHSIIMGRKVFEGLSEYPLEGRENIVLSRTKSYDNVPTFRSIEKALEYVEGKDLVYVIGGGEIYRQLWPKIDKLFVTEIHQAYEGDTYFPEYRSEIGSAWKEIKREDKADLSFVVYQRIN